MASIVKANANLASGGLATIRRSVQATDGVLSYDVEYVCLPQFSQNHIARFRKGADPITPMPQGINGLAITKQPKMYDFNLKIENGLAYLKARYAGPMPSVGTGNADDGEWTVTRSSDIKNVTWTTTRDVGYYQTPVGVIGGGQQFVKTGEETVTNSADYVSITETASSTNQELPAVSGSVGAMFNVRGNIYSPGAPTLQIVETTSESRNSKGITTYSKSSTGLLVS